MQFNSVVIRTKDMEKSINFYETVLGFTFDHMISATPNKRIAFLVEKASGVSLELIQNESANPPSESRTSLTFKVDQISDAKTFLEKHNVRIICEPRTAKDGKKILTALDPNGVELDFIEFRHLADL